ncbi:hypothetical protein PG993_007875 [Apiospora rasikravindrae]|uniref:Uncharacterized protein n=1 Tax=Apiospora rasikravindrae TaxID=990691 RepID=A0ABR1SYR4_9PEZI
MARCSLLSLPVEVRDQIFDEAIRQDIEDNAAPPWPWMTRKTLNALMATCKAISDEVYTFYMSRQKHQSDIAILICHNEDQSGPWLIVDQNIEIDNTNSADIRFYIQDLDDPKLNALARYARGFRKANIHIEIPRSAAELAYTWLKIRDMASILPSLSSVESIHLHYDSYGCTEYDIKRFHDCPIQVNRTCLSSLNVLFCAALTDPLIKGGPLMYPKMPAKPFAYHFCPNDPFCYDSTFVHLQLSCRRAERILRTVDKGICTPGSLNKRAAGSLTHQNDLPSLTTNEVMELRHEMRTLSTAIDLFIDTVIGKEGDMLRRRRFATWDCTEKNAMSLSAQHHLLRGAGPEDQSIRNREKLRDILKPQPCSKASSIVDTWFHAYPDGIEPLDLLAVKPSNRLGGEELEFRVQEISFEED